MVQRCFFLVECWVSPELLIWVVAPLLRDISDKASPSARSWGLGPAPVLGSPPNPLPSCVWASLSITGKSALGRQIALYTAQAHPGVRRGATSGVLQLPGAGAARACGSAVAGGCSEQNLRLPP